MGYMNKPQIKIVSYSLLNIFWADDKFQRKSIDKNR